MISFDDYVRLRGDRLVRLARVLVRDRHLAEDLVQEVLGRAYARWDRIARTDDPDLYLRRMLINGHISWRRRRSSTEVAADTTAEHRNRADRADIGAEAAERDAAWRLIATCPRSSARRSCCGTTRISTTRRSPGSCDAHRSPFAPRPCAPSRRYARGSARHRP